MDRVKEALAANDWSGQVDLSDVSDGEWTGFEVEAAEVERDMAGLKMTMASEDDNEQDEVDKLEINMQKLLAVKGELLY